LWQTVRIPICVRFRECFQLANLEVGARYTTFYPSIVLNNLDGVAADAKARFIQQISLTSITNALPNGTTLSEIQLNTIVHPVDYIYIDTSYMYVPFTFGDGRPLNGIQHAYI
jgi:hypothetical protein